MQEPVYVLHLITCHGRIMPCLAELFMIFTFFVENHLLGNIKSFLVLWFKSYRPCSERPCISPYLYTPI